MTENVNITPGSGAIIAADQITDATLGTSMVQYLKIIDGTIGGTNKVTVTASNALKVDGSAVTQPVSGTFWQTTQPISGSISVTGSVAVTGTFWQATQPISAASLPLPAGAAIATNQPTAATIGSTTSGQTGNLAMGAVTTGAPSYTTATTNNLSLTTVGNLRVDGSSVTQPVSGTFWQTTQPVSGTFWQATQPVSASSLPLPTGAATSANQQTAIGIGSATSGQTGGLEMGAVTTGAPTYTSGTSNAISLTTTGAQRVDGSGVTQPVSLVSLPLPTGAATAAGQPSVTTQGVTITGQTGQLQMGSVTTAAPAYTTATVNSISLTTVGNLRVDGSSVTQPVSGTVSISGSTTVTGTVTSNQGTSPWLCSGNVSIGASTSGVAPTLLGGTAATANPTAATAGNAVNVLIDKLGKVIAVGAIRTLKGVQATTITSTTETTIVTAGAAGVFQDVYAITLANSSATACYVSLKDATAGTTRMVIYVPAGDTRGFTVPVDSAMPQAVAANNWTATLSAAVTSIYVTALYVSNT
jgi:hypothetical protein